MMQNFVIGLLALLFGGQWLLSDSPVWGAAAFFMALLLLVRVKKAGRQEARHLQMGDMPPEYAAMVQESWAKALADHERLAKVQTKIRDAELRRHLKELVQESSRMLDYLEPRAERVLAARRFIDYYQDRAANFSEEYLSLEQTGLETEQVRQTRARLKETLLGFEAAYAAEFEKILNPQLMDMDAEMSVMQQHFETEGLTHGKKTESAARSGEKAENRKTAKGWRPADFSGVPSSERGNVIKDKIILSLLAIFLGAIGAHKFYRGKTIQGVFYVLFCWSFLPAFIGFCEGLHYLFMPLDRYYKKYYR